MATKRDLADDMAYFIRNNYVDLIYKLDVRSVIPHLYQGQILTMSQMDRIKSKETRQDKASELLDTLSHTGKCTIDVFMNALRQTEQTALIEMLDVGSQHGTSQAAEPSGSRGGSRVRAGTPVDDNPAPLRTVVATPPGTKERSPEVKAGSSKGTHDSTESEVLLLNHEYGTSKGGISTINGEMARDLTDARAAVSCTVLRAPQEDVKSAEKDGVRLIKPFRDEGDVREPSLDWLTFDHRHRYPDLPDDITCIVGHADVTDKAARRIKDDRYPQADLVTVNHVIPEDTERYKGGRTPMEAWQKELDILKMSDGAKAAFSVGLRIFNHFSTMYKGNKKPRSHYLYLPRPPEMFVKATVEAGGEGEKAVLSAGRVRKVEKLKGHDLAARAMGKVAKKIKDVKWRVRGINEDDYETSKKILEDNLRSGILKPTLLPYGTQEEIRDDMTTAHLVLMPSRSEPFGLVGLEAIAAGIPVLISSQSGLADLITDLIKKKKLHADRRLRIVETSVNESDLDADAERWAAKILDTLENIEAEFEKAAEFKRELVASEYWVESHQAFLQACGVTADPARH